MAEGNNIRFDDIFPDFDESINKAIKNLDRLNNSFEKLFDNLSSEGKKLKEVFNKFDPGTKEFDKASRSADEYKQRVMDIKRIQSTLNDSFAELKNRQEALRKEQKALNRDTKEGADRFDELQVELITTSQALNKLNQATRTAARTAESATGSYDQLSAELNQARKELRSLDNAFDQTTGAINKNNKEAVRLQNRIVKLDGALKNFDKSIGQNFRNVGDYEGAINKAGASLGKFTLALAGGFTAVTILQRGFSEAIKSFTEFDLATAKLEAIAGASSEQLARLEFQAKQLGASTQFSATQVADLQLSLSKLGFTAERIEDSTEAILNFAVATDSELARAGEVVAGTLNSFGLEASKATKVADIAAKSFSRTALDIEKFSTAIGIAGATAKASGVSLEETSALLGTLTDANVEASSAATALRKILAVSAKENIDYRDALEQINNSTNKLAKANELFGLTAQSQAVILADNIDKIDDLTRSFENSAGAAANAAEVIGDTLSGDLKRLESAFEAFTLSILDGEGALGSFVRGITNLATSVLELLTPQERLSDSLQREKQELNDLVGAITQTSEGTKVRAALIDELNTKYPEFLENVDKETVSNEELLETLQKVNREFSKRIELQLKKEEIDDLNRSLKDTIKNLQQANKDLVVAFREGDEEEVERLLRFIVFLEELQKKYESVLNDLSDEYDGLAGSIGNVVNETGELDEATKESIKLIKDQTDLISDLRKQRDEASTEGDIERLNRQIKLEEEELKRLKDLGRARVEISGAINKQRLILSDLRKERDSASEDAIAGFNKRIKLAEEELKRLESLGEQQKEISQFQVGQTGLEFSEVEDEISAQEKLQNQINDINENARLTDQQRKEKLLEAEKEFNDELFKIKLFQAQADLQLLEYFGEKEFETIEDFNLAKLEAEKKVNDLEIELAKKKYRDLEAQRKEASERELEDARQRQQQLSELAGNPVIEGTLQGLEKLSSKRLEQEKAEAQQIEDAEARQAALDQIAKKEFRRQLLLASIRAFTAELERSGDIKKAGQAATSVIIIGGISEQLAGFEKGGLVEGGEQIIRINEKGQEFVIDAPTTKALGLDRKGSSMQDFQQIMNERQFDLSNIYNQTTDKLIQINHESKGFEFNERHSKMIAKDIAKAMPDISGLIHDLDGNIHRTSLKNNVRERRIYKKQKSKFRNSRTY